MWRCSVCCCEHHHATELKAVEAGVQDERQISAELQDQLEVARSEMHEERSQAQLRQASLQPIQGLLHLVSSLLDAVIIPGVMTCLT